MRASISRSGSIFLTKNDMKQGIVIVTTVFLFLGCKSRAGEQSRKTEAPIASVEQKVETLKKCGLTLAPPFAVTDLTKSLSPETLNEGGYDTVLSAMGSAEENAPGRNYSPNVWYFDTEAISDTGDYKRIAELCPRAFLELAISSGFWKGPLRAFPVGSKG